jgi:hypothetical protein
MQMNPNTFKELQAKYPELQGKNLAAPETNILAGAYYMKDMKAQPLPQQSPHPAYTPEGKRSSSPEARTRGARGGSGGGGAETGRVAPGRSPYVHWMRRPTSLMWTRHMKR